MDGGGRALAPTRSGYLATAPDLFEADARGRTLVDSASGLLDLEDRGRAGSTSRRSLGGLAGSTSQRSLAPTKSGLLRDVAGLLDEVGAVTVDGGDADPPPPDAAAAADAETPPEPDGDKCPVCLTEWGYGGAEGQAARPCCGRAVCDDCASFLSMMGSGAQCPLCKAAVVAC